MADAGPTQGPTQGLRMADAGPTQDRRRADARPTQDRRRTDAGPTQGRRRADAGPRQGRRSQPTNQLDTSEKLTKTKKNDHTETAVVTAKQGLWYRHGLLATTSLHKRNFNVTPPGSQRKPCLKETKHDLKQ